MAGFKNHRSDLSIIPVVNVTDRQKTGAKIIHIKVYDLIDSSGFLNLSIVKIHCY